MIRVGVDTAAVTAALAQLESGLVDLRRASTAVTIQATLIARRKAPRRTGRLRQSIRGETGRNYSTVFVAGAARAYGGVISYGWRRHNIEADRFTQETAAIMRLSAPREYADAIRDLIRRTRLT